MAVAEIDLDAGKFLVKGYASFAEEDQVHEQIHAHCGL